MILVNEQIAGGDGVTSRALAVNALHITSQGGCTGTSTVVCNLGAIPSGGGATVTAIVQAQSSGNLDSQAEVSSDAPDPDTSDNSATVTVSVLPQAIRQGGR